MRQKIKELLIFLSKAYQAEIDLETECTTWMFVLDDEDYTTIKSAVKKWMQTEKRMPKAQDIFGVINSTYSNVKEWKPKYDIVRLWDEEKVEQEGGISFDEFFNKYFKKTAPKKD